MRRRPNPNPPTTDATRFTLFELLVLIGFASIAFAVISRGQHLLGTMILLTVIAFRTSIVDFTSLGGFAVLLTMIFGITSIALLVVWSIGL